MIKLSVDNITNWILVTGVIRSGTTFVGKVLSLPLQVDYIHEPFGKRCGIPGCEEMPSLYIRPNPVPDEARRYDDLLSRLFTYDFVLKTSQYNGDPWTRKLTKSIIGSRGPFHLRLAKMNPFHKAAVIKDPNAKFAAEYLYLRFGVKPVIVIKHPLSLAASLKRVGWWPGVHKFAEQAHLVEDYFSDERHFLEREWADPALQSAAHWRATHKVLLAQASRYSDWIVVTHEELSGDPIGVFRGLYQSLELPWSRLVARKIRKLTTGNGSARPRKGKVQDFRRNSADIFKRSRDSLSRKERQAIFEIVEDVALQIYPRESFALDQ